MNTNTFFIIFFTLKIAALLVDRTSGKGTRNATRTDLSECKLTHIGTDYQGQKGTTGGGVRCQSWHAQDPLHKISSEIKDNDFPERSMRLAKNYCRNPTRDPKGPWCYTMEPALIDDECGIPLCNFGECRISGTGAEYGGTKRTSVTGRKCESWDKRHKLPEGRTERFSSVKFPDLSRSKAKNFCRNPDDDTGGPWCYIEDENYDNVEKQYCDVPFCDDRDCLVYVRNASVYSTLTKLNATYGNITLWMKLWNPLDEQNAEARLLLSLLATPTSAKKIAQDWRAGVEIIISNAGSGQTFPTSEDEQDFENTPNIILGSKWTGVWINWGGGYISVGLYGTTKPIFVDQYSKKKSISSLYPDNFLHYGLMGTGVLWSTEFCQEACEVHTTFGSEYLRVWPLQPINTTYDVRFNVRASKDITMKLYQTPGSIFPCLTISIGTADTVTLVYQKSEKSSNLHLKDVPGKGLLDFWTWKEFTLSIFGPDLRLFSRRAYGNEEILQHKDDLFATMRWYSVGSLDNVAMWTFFCSPEFDPVEKPSPPNCIANLEEFKYEGAQWTASNDMPCAPWIAPEVPDDDKKPKSFVDGSATKAMNKCRNPGRDPKGPYCYSISLENTLTVSKQYCPIRKCRFSECRMAGTGNDYMGTLSSTRSGRTCAKWMSDYDYERLEKGTTESATTTPTPPFMSRGTEMTLNPPLTGGDEFEDWRAMGRNGTNVTGASTSPSTRDTTETSMTDRESVPATATTLANTEKTGRVWKVDEYLKHREKNVTVDWGTTPADFLEHLRSNETSERSKRSEKPIHLVNPKYFNDSLYPEHSVRNASNYCRDPSRNIAGTWCYTTDPEVPQDLCNVKDCDMPEECIFFVRGQGIGRRLYVLPEHRSEGLDFSLKAWEPDRPDSITFVFTADDGLKSRYILKVGALDNEKVMLYYQDEEEGLKLVKTKTLPHLLYLGKWSSFVIKIPRGHVMIHYQGAPSPLFQWDHPEPAKAFLPVYYYYTSEHGHTIGVSFDCATRCHIENTQTEKFSRILPLSAWSKSPVVNPDRIELMIRADGIIRIPLLMFPGVPGYYSITLGERKNMITFIKTTYPKMNIFHKQRAPAPLFTRHTWTNITLMWFDKTINVFWNETPVFHYEHTHPLIFYYFSLAVESDGWATWVANCVPADIDGAPEDGGWSEWSPWACSASCNGGVGTRKRVCNNPLPNVRGEPCLGPDVMSGRCNTILCGDITEDTVKFIKRRIRRNHTALSAKENEAVTIPSDPDIVKAITTESPDSEIQWSLNGIFLHTDERLEIVENNVGCEYKNTCVFGGLIDVKFDAFDEFVNSDTLNVTVIRKARINDSGVYTITFHRVDGSHMIFKMASLVVYPVTTVVTIRETLPLTVVCHCVTLGYLYSDLSISWTVGKRLWKDYGTTLPISVNVDTVTALNKSHEGLWECVVEQDDLEFKWITNAILVKVIGPPNWRTHLMEDEFTRPIFGWMPNEIFVVVSAVIILLALTACIVVGTGFYVRFRKMGKFVGPVGKHEKTAETKRAETGKGPSSRKVETIGTQHAGEDKSDEEIVESSKTRKSIFRRSKTHDNEKLERQKLIADTETEESS